jgi:hypothetical protein
MTLVCLSLCGLIGALWIATGSGVVAQRVLGSTVIGGMIAASAIAIFLIPVAFYAIEHLFSGWKSIGFRNCRATRVSFWCISITSANLFL